jgi:hydroxyacylglutathione hydrolase
VPDPVVVAMPNGQFAQNCYLIADAAASRAVLVDPGEEWESFLEALARRDWTLDAIWLTHAHLDHVLGVGPIRQRTGAPVWLHPAERPVYDTVAPQGLWFGVRVPDLPPPDRDFVAGQAVAVGTHRFTVRHTPGHSPGSVTLVGHGMAFVGDVLFAGSIGRTDLPGGDFDTLMASIRDELLTLPEDTVVYSGHGPATTIGRERTGNPFLA